MSTVTIAGGSRHPGVRAGDTVTVENLPGADATYGVTQVRHRWSREGYENTFAATPARRWSPERRPGHPIADGAYPARVAANHDPHNQGRVRVRYWWQEENETTWVRLLAPHAGPGRGILFLPEVGDEVAVLFEEGDPARPYVVGSAWNGVHQPPATGFHQPGEQNGSEFAGNHIKRIVTKSGHRITLVDTPGRETISFATPASNRLMLTEAHEETGGRPAVVLHTEGDLFLSAPNGRIHTRSLLHSKEVGASGAELVEAAEMKTIGGQAQSHEDSAVKLKAWRAQHSTAILRAVADERKLLLKRRADLSAWHDDTKAASRTWFGSDSLQTREVLLDRTDKELALNKRLTLKNFRPPEPNQQDVNTFAYVYANDKSHTIHLDQQFDAAPAVGYDSKAGTLAHEMSHYTSVSGTHDYQYGAENCKALAQIAPQHAINNADNYEFFIEGIK